MSAIEVEKRLATEIKLHRTVRRIVHEETGRSPECWKMIRAKSSQLFTQPFERLRHKGLRSSLKIEFDIQKLVHPKEQSHKDRLRNASFGDDYSMRLECCPPSGFLVVFEVALRSIDGFLQRFRGNFKRSRGPQLPNSCPLIVKITFPHE